MTQNSLFGSKANTNYFPRQDIRDFVDEEMVILHEGFQRVIINPENEIITPEFGMIKDIVNGRALVVKGRFLDDDSHQQFFLWDIKGKKPIVELSYYEF